MTESWTTVNLLPASSRFRSTLGAADDDVMFFEDENWESHIKSQKTTSNFPFGDWISIMFTKIYTTYIIYIICLECICKMCFLDISIIYTIHTHIYIYISIYTFFETVPLCEWIYTWACPLGPHHSWTLCPGVFLLGGGTVRMIWRGGLPFLFEQINHRKPGELCLNVLTYPLNWCSARW